jgi:hypothetical protein
MSSSSKPRTTKTNIVAKEMLICKNTIISTFHQLILFVGLTLTGHNHSYKMLKSEFPSKKAWFKHLRIFVDLGGLSGDLRRL